MFQLDGMIDWGGLRLMGKLSGDDTPNANRFSDAALTDGWTRHVGRWRHKGIQTDAWSSWMDRMMLAKFSITNCKTSF